MSVRSPDLKPCPKCGHQMNWFINSDSVKKLTEETDHLIWQGYTCSNIMNCGYSEEWKK